MSALEALAEARGLEELATPFLAVDLDAMERNIARMQAFFEGRRANIRPHAKTHKCTAIARLQVEAGASGITCSTTDEVRAMAAAGIGDLLLANVVTTGPRLRALAAAGRAARVTAAVDSPEVVRLLAEAARAGGTTLGAVVDVDIGMGRNGVASVEEGLRLADEVASTPGLELRGVMAYEGHLVSIPDREERARRAVEAFEPARALARELEARGYPVPMFTGGSTATYDSSGAMPEMTDVQAGTYVLMDADYVRLSPEFEPAAVVVATVTTARPTGAFVVDVGSKRLSRDDGKPELAGGGAEYVSTSEEHSNLQSLDGRRRSVGARVALVPGHVCTTMAMHRSFAGCRGGELEGIIEIDARDPLA